MKLFSGTLAALMTSPLFAQAADGATPPKGPSTYEMLIMPAGFLLIMYFFIIRPQQKKAKDQADLISSLKPGDEVVTTGGIIGKVRSVAETFFTIEVSNNTSIKVLKANVTGLTKPAATAAAVKEPLKT
jgi:preprotein translocase subunit YajC